MMPCRSAAAGTVAGHGRDPGDEHRRAARVARVRSRLSGCPHDADRHAQGVDRRGRSGAGAEATRGDDRTMTPAPDATNTGDGLAERLARCYTGVVYDVLRDRGIVQCILPPSIVPLDRAMVAAGPVFTVRGRPDASVSAHESLLRWTELLSRAPRGHVVMVQGNDGERALMGELSAETLQFRGVRGYIVDGG